jgi:hypothetical protein
VPAGQVAYIEDRPMFVDVARGLGLTDDEQSQVYGEWNHGELNSRTH